MNETRGLVTVATGSKKYYKVALNLLKSYRAFSKEPLPFCILADEENEYTRQFDDTIILKSPQHSFLDKIYVFNNIPYKETLFVESDCIAYGDLNLFLEPLRESKQDFALFGTNYPLNHAFNRAEWGWFTPQQISEGGGTYKVNFIPRFGSTVMYLKQGLVCEQMYRICQDVWMHADDYHFLPLDDELIAVATSVMNCQCVNGSKEYDVVVYPFYKNKKWNPIPNMERKNLSYDRSEYGHVDGALLCHWGNVNTTKPLYKREVAMLNNIINGTNRANIFWNKIVYFLLLVQDAMLFIPKKVKASIQNFICKHPKLRTTLKPIEIIYKKFGR